MIKSQVIKILNRIRTIDRKLSARLAGPAAFIHRLQSRSLLYIVYHSFLIYLVVEMLSRRSVTAGVMYLFEEPLVFLYNWLLVMLTMSVALFFRKRGFLFVLISMIWLGLGITNCILLGYRTTPLNFMDFRTFKDVMSIINVYFNSKQILLIGLGIGALALLVIVLFLRTPRHRVRYHRAAATVISLAVLFGGATAASVSSGTIVTTFHNIQDAYKDYGFAYCFAASVVDRGISKPGDYSRTQMQSIVDQINAEAGDAAAEEVIPSSEATEETPNVIILQMESFFDPSTLKNVSFSENPLPVFQSLKDNYSSGWLTTPSFGAGTSNTEFEVNTGMSLDAFGPGEYPYTTILRETTSESIGYNLKQYGYSTHAIHNHTGKFYGRYLVYPNLGFDSFTSVEYMDNVERNPLNWADDSCLTDEITKALASTENQDYVFAVSVQGHGKYPTEVIDDSQTITVEGFNEEESTGFEYFVNQIHDMDAFLGELTDTLSQSEEPTVLVIYGDHLPKFSITNDDVINGNVYQTEYVIWNNFGLQEQDEDLTTYQLAARVMNDLDMHSGVMTKFQQFCQDDSNYYQNMHDLQYDILYGENWVYGGSSPFVQTEMTMGIDPITMSGLSAVGDTLYVTGENFTSASKIFINGTQVSTKYLSSGRISCKYGDEITEGDTVEVIQMSSKKTQLSSAGEWTWYPDGPYQTREPIPNISQYKAKLKEEAFEQSAEEEITEETETVNE